MTIEEFNLNQIQGRIDFQISQYFTDHSDKLTYTQFERQVNFIIESYLENICEYKKYRKVMGGDLAYFCRSYLAHLPSNQYNTILLIAKLKIKQ